MALKGTAGRYGALEIGLHWISAAAILALLAVGFSAAITSDIDLKARLLRFHVPLGTLVLVLTLTRLVWWLFDVRPDDPAGQPRWQAMTAHAVHGLLYLVLIVMSSSGIGLLILSGAGAILFAGAPGPLPDFLDFPPMVVHAIGVFTLLGLLGLHVGAAAYHQIWKRDRLLARMGVGRATQA